MRGKGCNSCQKSGFRGRVRHLRDVDCGLQGSRDDFRQYTRAQEIRNLLQWSAGMTTLYQDGIDKVLQGLSRRSMKSIGWQSERSKMFSDESLWRQ